MYPEEYAAWEHDPFTFAPTGGEPGQRVLERGVRAFQEIVLAHPVNVCSSSHTRRRSGSSSRTCSVSIPAAIAIDSISCRRA